MWPASTSMPSSTGWIGSSVRRARISSISLLKSGERCWTTTNAIPVSAGTLSKKRSSASSPPADAPMPTTNAGWP